MKRVALFHANDELADRLVAGADAHLAGWQADRIDSRVDTLAHIRALDRAKQCMNDYDVIQVDTTVGPGPPAQLASTLSGTPLVWYMRGWGDYTNYHGQYGWRKRNRIRAKTRLLCRTTAAKAGISEALVAGMSNMYPMADAQVVERPYDVDRFASGYAGGESDTTTVLTVTNLRYAEKRDGVITCLRAMQPILAERDDVEYVIAGEGRHLPAIERRAAEIDGATAAGYVEDVPGLLASADVFAYVSFLDGAPSTVYEAQAAGLPVVGGDAAGVPEAVGDAGEVVPPTPKGVRASLRRLIADERRREELAKASKEKMDTHNERVMADWAALWESAIA